ncbi:MAG: hypothetical protein P4L16_00825 [Chlamydiales bacterium]|nr:hypothetical protein [Chlamydiales bacterium]
MNGRTKEEHYILKLYELAKKSGSQLNSKDCFAVGSELGLSEKVVKPIVNILTQANFIKKTGEKSIALTSRGEELVKNLLGQK